MKWHESLSMPHVVYRLFNRDGELIYIGMTRSFGSRFEQHITRKWWTEVARIEIEHHPDAISARRAEGAAILIENPKYNIVAGDDVALGVVEPPPPRGDGVHCPRCTAVKEERKRAYCDDCLREYQLARRRRLGVKPKPPASTTCPRCGGPKDAGPNYCKPCKKAYSDEYRRTH
ncbi:GIY-YIG nuclease family protein [Bradyrhizobium sp. Pear77]|nr:GIY-YIG nuclease family protein [Bradyrhizobium altum]